MAERNGKRRRKTSEQSVQVHSPTRSRTDVSQITVANQDRFWTENS